MSVAKILMSGVLVAGGLILGTFAAAGYLDPQWTQNQLAATARQEPVGEPKALSVFRRTRFVSEAAAGQRPAGNPIVRTSTKASPISEVRPATAKPANKPPSKRKVVERAKDPPPKAQQTAAQFQWPWQLFGN